MHEKVYLLVMPNPFLLDDLMRTLKVPAVRDLAWAIGSPTLLDPRYPLFTGRLVEDEFCMQQLAGAERWLTDLDQAAEPLHAFLGQRHTHRLGHYFENLIEFWLHHSATEHLRAGLQVRTDAKAVGEFDFVFRSDAWGGWHHWETAVKFYLESVPADDWRAFLGPNPEDCLDDKLHKLFDRQLALSEQEASLDVLRDVPRPVAARAFVKGYLFFPLGSDTPEIRGISSRCLHGWWIRFGDGTLSQIADGSHWQLLPRLSWLAPAFAVDDAAAHVFDLSHMETVVARHFHRSTTPLLLAQMVKGDDGDWHEVSRGFIVPPRWPAA
jgi:hypothetical protein